MGRSGRSERALEQKLVSYVPTSPVDVQRVKWLVELAQMAQARGDDLTAAQCFRQVVEEAQQALRLLRALDMSEQKNRRMDFVQLWVALARAQFEIGDRDDGIALQRVLVGFHADGREDPAIARPWRHRLFLMLKTAGRLQEAIDVLEEQIESYERNEGSQDPETLKWIGALAETYAAAGDYRHAVESARVAVDGRRNVFGASHPLTLLMENELGTYEIGDGDFSGGFARLRRISLAARTTLRRRDPVRKFLVGRCQVLEMVLTDVPEIAGITIDDLSAPLLFRAIMQELVKREGLPGSSTLDDVRRVAEQVIERGQWRVR